MARNVLEDQSEYRRSVVAKRNEFEETDGLNAPDVLVEHARIMAALVAANPNFGSAFRARIKSAVLIYEAAAQLPQPVILNSD